MTNRPTWHGDTTMADWLLDGRPIRHAHDIELWNSLDWSKAYVDLGPSPGGNVGPYWHVPHKDDDTVHRLYPKVLATKWLFIIRRAIREYHVLEKRRARSKRKDKAAVETLGYRRALSNLLLLLALIFALVPAAWFVADVAINVDASVRIFVLAFLFLIVGIVGKAAERFFSRD